MNRDARIQAPIDLSLERDTRVSTLAAHVGLSPARFSHLFAREIGILPGHYLWLLRSYRREKMLAQAILRESILQIDPQEGWQAR